LNTHCIPHCWVLSHCTNMWCWWFWLMFWLCHTTLTNRNTKRSLLNLHVPTSTYLR
jgi:hypothetical protein